MSYAAAAALQTAVFARLSADAGLAGVTILDAIPAAAVPDSYVLLGAEVVLDQSDASGPGAEHRFEVAVISTESGFQSAKTIAAAVSQALVGQVLPLSAGYLVSIGFLRAAAKRLDDGVTRRIDLTFRARVAF